eukprot:scaffold93719_cov85-Phaeocystis_antarctica.AAC.2
MAGWVGLHIEVSPEAGTSTTTPVCAPIACCTACRSSRATSSSTHAARRGWRTLAWRAWPSSAAARTPPSPLSVQSAEPPPSSTRSSAPPPPSARPRTCHSAPRVPQLARWRGDGADGRLCLRRHGAHGIDGAARRRHQAALPPHAQVAHAAAAMAAARGAGRRCRQLGWRRVERSGRGHSGPE